MKVMGQNNLKYSFDNLDFSIVDSEIPSMVFSILPKNQLETSNFCPSQLGQKFFVRFGRIVKDKNVILELTEL